MHLAVNPDIYIHIDLILNERPGGIGKQNLRLISYFLNGLCMTDRGMRSIGASRNQSNLWKCRVSKTRQCRSFYRSSNGVFLSIRFRHHRVLAHLGQFSMSADIRFSARRKSDICARAFTVSILITGAWTANMAAVRPRLSMIGYAFIIINDTQLMHC